MKVIATKPGFFGKLRAAGDEFDVPEGTKAASWFDPVEPVEPVEPAKPTKAKKAEAGGQD